MYASFLDPTQFQSRVTSSAAVRAAGVGETTTPPQQNSTNRTPEQTMQVQNVGMMVGGIAALLGAAIGVAAAMTKR